jgi:hypothetical protein
MSAIDEILAAHFRKQKETRGAKCQWCGADESLTKLRWNSKEGVIECIPENEVECIARCKEKANYKKWEHFVPIRPEVYI